VPTQGLTPPSWVSEIKLQSKLDAPWIVGSLSEAEGAIGIRVAVRASGLRRCFIPPVRGSDICTKVLFMVHRLPITPNMLAFYFFLFTGLSF
jgi:hypothetical protein